MNTQMPAKETSCSGRWEVSRASHRIRPRKAARARHLQERQKASTLSMSFTQQSSPRGPRAGALRVGRRTESCVTSGGLPSFSESNFLTGKIKTPHVSRSGEDELKRHMYGAEHLVILLAPRQQLICVLAPG